MFAVWLEVEVLPEGNYKYDFASTIQAFGMLVTPQINVNDVAVGEWKGREG